MKTIIYKFRFLILGFLIFMSGQIAAQDRTQIITPILIDKSALSGVGLEKVDLKDEPEKDFYQRRLFWGDDLGIFVVSTESWVNRMDNFPFDEYIYMYHGEVEVRPDEGTTQQFYTGDHFWAPKGYTGEWEIKAGDHLHYELSVIATRRADTSTIVKGEEHTLINPSDISGSHIKLDDDGLYQKVLKQGVELTIALHAESPRESQHFVNDKEQLIHLISGQITIECPESESSTFYAGDFFILRNGLKGKWKSEGHGLVKYLSVLSSH